MIAEKNLEEFFDAIRSNKGAGLSEVMTAVKETAVKNNIPMEITWETVSFGKMLKTSNVECLHIWHPGHVNDYFSLIVHQDGKELKIFRHGFSKQWSKKMEKQKVKQSGGTFVKGLLGGHGHENSWVGAMANVAGAGIMMKGTAGMLYHAVKSLGGNKEEFKAEEAWYDAIYNMIRQAC